MAQSETNINTKDLNTLTEKKEKRNKLLQKFSEYSLFIGALFFFVGFALVFFTSTPSLISTPSLKAILSFFGYTISYIFLFLLFLIFEIMKNPHTGIGETALLMLIGVECILYLLPYLSLWSINSVSAIVILIGFALIQFGLIFIVIGKVFSHIKSK
jgi:cation transport ATPase